MLWQLVKRLGQLLRRAWAVVLLVLALLLLMMMMVTES
jgi:hypothetical protein